MLSCQCTACTTLACSDLNYSILVLVIFSTTWLDKIQIDSCMGLISRPEHSHFPPKVYYGSLPPFQDSTILEEKQGLLLYCFTLVKMDFRVNKILRGKKHSHFQNLLFSFQYSDYQRCIKMLPTVSKRTQNCVLMTITLLSIYPLLYARDIVCPCASWMT